MSGINRTHVPMVALAVAVLLAVAVSVCADMLVSNLDPANAGHQTVYGPNANGLYGETGGGVSIIVPSTSNYYLNTISAICMYVSGNSTTFELALYDDLAGLPGSKVASRSLVAATTSSYAAYTADFGSHVQLTAGNTYWAAILAPGADNDLKLYIKKGTTLDGSRRAMYGNMGETLPDGSPKPPYWMHMSTPGFEVDGSPVPEPSGLLALSGGVAALIGLARRRQGRAL